MTAPGKDSRSKGARSTRAFRLNPIAAACALLLFAGGTAQAQTAPDPAANDAAAQEAAKKAQAARKEAEKKAATSKVDSVLVTGIRASIESSVATKRDSNSIVEVITAEDIGKLPDLSIAESLARLPGIAGQRVDGRVQSIAIRGLSPDFAGVLLNGREQVSTGDNRGVEFDQYPSELIYRATVYKTPDAALVGQGLAGTVNMESVKPLDFRSRQVTFNVRGEHNSTGKQVAGISENGNRVSASYIDQFANNTIGLAVGVAHLDSPLQAQKYKAFGWSVSPANQNFIRQSGITADPGIPLGLITGFEVGPQSSTQRRDGAMAVLEYRPNANLHSTVDAFYSTFKTREANNLFQTFNFGRFGGVMSDLTFDGDIVNSGLFSTYSRFEPPGSPGDVKQAVLRTQRNTRDDTLGAVGWNTELKLGDWSTSADLSYSRADRNDKRLEAYSRLDQPDTIRFDIPPTGGAFPTFTLGRSYTDASTLLLSEQFGRLGYSQRPDIKDELTSVRIDGKRGLNWFVFSDVELGVNLSKRDKSRDWNEDYFRAATPTTQIAIASDLLTDPAPAGFAGIPGFLGFDLEGALNRYGTVTQFLDGNTFGRRWSVHEKISTAFARLDIDTVVDSIPIRGNVGVQWVATDQDSDGFDQSFRSGVPVAVAVNKGASYSNVLPNLNVVAEFTPGFLGRFGAARSVARPRMDEMRAFNSASLNDKGLDPVTGERVFRWEGSGGNPFLKPWVADTLDLSFERYFGKGSYVAVAGFQKYLRSYIYNQVTTIDYTGYPNETGNTPTTNFGTFNRPENGQGGTLRGLEVSVALAGGLFTPVLDGFGVVASGSDTSSDIQPNGPGTSVKLPGLSGRVTNLTLYYEKSGLSARISERKRSPFRAEVTGLFGFRDFVTSKSDAVVDMQLGYTFTAGMFKGLGILLQVNNLTNSGYETFRTDAAPFVERPSEYNRFGRQYLLGVTYRM